MLVRIVGWEPGAPVNLEVEHVADRIGIFRAVQTMDRRTAGIRLGCARAVELRFEPRHESGRSAGIWPRQAGRGHGPEAKFVDNLLPDLRILTVRSRECPLKHESGGPLPLAVARDAVF